MRWWSVDNLEIFGYVTHWSPISKGPWYCKNDKGIEEEANGPHAPIARGLKNNFCEGGSVYVSKQGEKMWLRCVCRRDNTQLFRECSVLLHSNIDSILPATIKYVNLIIIPQLFILHPSPLPPSSSVPPINASTIGYFWNSAPRTLTNRPASLDASKSKE